MPVPLTPALALSMELLGVPVLVVPSSVAASYAKYEGQAIIHYANSIDSGSQHQNVEGLSQHKVSPVLNKL
uniref:Uncharacterized protein n=1 Tax=Spironucleus salmonicida TaxID=348837 RepID=V6LKH6_9EUKA|eukprot:EST44853.1 Hypothetical protein SS50377_15248 [Spironucleus salmonicida]